MDFKPLVQKGRKKRLLVIDMVPLILSRREELMGIAMSFVVLYHLFCWCNYGYFDLFKYGYVGVDIFMFISGLGLCFSYTRRCLSSFYYRRFLRIYPLFIFFNVVLFCISYDGVLNTEEIIGSLTTLSFYNTSSNSKEWFISSILLLYIIFPIVFKLTNTKSLIACILVVLFVVTYFKLDWRHDCLIARLPIFMLGVLSYKIHNAIPRKYEGFSMYGLYWTFVAICVVSFMICQSTSFFGAMLCPFILAIIVNSIRTYNMPFLKYIGSHSLEFFLANAIVGHYMICEYQNLWIGYKVLLYFLIQIIFSFIFIGINSVIYKLYR